MKNGVVDHFEETEKLYDNPLPEALKSLQKCEELDPEGKLNKKVKEYYERLKRDFKQQGIEDYYKPNYTGAFKDFSSISVINEQPVMEGTVDTTFLFYAGMAAYKAEMHDEAIEYFEKSIKYNYDEPELYVYLKIEYFDVGDTAKGISTLKLAQAEDPTNLSYISAEGSLYDKMGEPDKAKEAYQKCIDMDSTFFDAVYNMGVLYYNEAYQMYKDAEKITNAKDYGAAVDAADVILAQALPYMERAHRINPKDRGTLETLKTLYYRMQMNDKYEAIKAELEALPEEAAEGEVK